jgi:hypothetical protein
MKQFSVIVSALALLATGVMYYLFFSEKHPERHSADKRLITAGGEKFTVAYFDMDSGK